MTRRGGARIPGPALADRLEKTWCAGARPSTPRTP